MPYKSRSTLLSNEVLPYVANCFYNVVYTPYKGHLSLGGVFMRERGVYHCLACFVCWRNTVTGFRAYLLGQERHRNPQPPPFFSVTCAASC